MSERLRDGRLGVLVAGLGIAVAVVVLTVSWATKERPFVPAVAQPSPLHTTPVIPVKPGATLCAEGVTFDPDGDVATIRVGTRAKPAVPLTVTASAPGWRAKDTIDDTWVDNDLLSFELDPPDEPLHGRFCVRNDGRRVVDLYAAEDSLTLIETTVDGRKVAENVQLAFLKSEPATIAGRAGDMVRRMTLFRPGVVVAPLLWLLAALVLVGIPAATIWAVHRALREPEGPPDDD